VSFLLDTDICSAYLKNHRQIRNRFIQYGGRLYISTITLGEHFVWTRRAKASPKRLQVLLDMLNEVQVIPVDESIAEKFGEIRAALLDVGDAAPQMDMMNAATALVHHLTLITHNVADYAKVPGLTVADWMIP
jgi:tRNA(fMet)-specific endonuclease VapC